MCYTHFFSLLKDKTNIEEINICTAFRAKFCASKIATQRPSWGEAKFMARILGPNRLTYFSLLGLSVSFK